MKGKNVVCRFGGFDLRMLNALEKTGFRSVSEVIKTAVAMAYSLHLCGKDGFSQLVVRNPESGEERVLMSSEHRKIAG